MPDKIPDNFISKPDALEKYQKPERTFQRRLAKALRIRNDDFLSNLLLVTSDGKIQQGIEVEQGTPQQLKDQGLYPVWYLDETWFATGYDEKAEPKDVPDPVGQPTIASEEYVAPNRNTLDRTSLVTEIESLRRELDREREHNNLISTQLAIKDEQIKAASKLALQSNEREKEFSSLLKQLAQRTPTTELASAQPNVTAVKPDSVPVVEVVNTQTKSSPKKTAKTKSVNKNKKSTTRKSKNKAAPKKKDLFPTFRKFLARS